MSNKCLECGHANDGESVHCIACGGALEAGRSAGVRRKTVLDGMEDSTPSGGLASTITQPAVVETTPVPPMNEGQSSGRRKTMLEAADATPAAAPAFTPAPSPARGGRKKTMLDEGPLVGATDAPGPRAGQGRAARAVGWMVSFDFNASGQDHVIREGRNRLGSSRDCEISLFYDPKTSEEHCYILYRRGECAVVDQGSTNGTLVNGKDIGISGTQHLKTGDTMTIGTSTFKLFLLDPDEVDKLWPEPGNGAGGDG